VRFANDVEANSRTLPLLVLNVDRIVERWLKAVDDCAREEEGLRALLEFVYFLFFLRWN